ncbi:hypothetical protein [Natrinema sp. SYSU A 869]|uniref:hypothetical protein n=1 Tax=Natrinema sp. SYSU A 869 TaxID=2871694 RepID=UPI002105361B|nr:hypothetical protein [Natrinema sp. SYSU A 869]
MELTEKAAMAKAALGNDFLRRQLLLSSIIGPVQKRIHGNDGEYIMDADWDNLLILDGCRYDLFMQLYANRSLEGEVSEFRSRGSSSPEFLTENFAGRTYNDTVYVTANPHEKRILDETFYHTDRAWIDEWSDDEGVVLPEDLADCALAAHESHPNKRLIVHFMQPHAPFIGDTRLDAESGLMEGLRGAVLEDDSDIEFESVWQALREGEVKAGVFWESYRDNLHRVLDEALPLADRLPGKTAITADHGNAVGEWATPFPVPVYFHPSNIRIPVLNTVPWYVPSYSERKPIVRSEPVDSVADSVAVEDTDDDSPADTEGDADEDVVEDRLSALGYLE